MAQERQAANTLIGARSSIDWRSSLRCSASVIVFCGVTAAAWCSSGSALAAEAAKAAAPSSTEVEEVVVTGSHAITNGANAPTPVTVATAENLEKAAPNTIAEALNQLPQFLGSQKAESAAFSRSFAGNGQNLVALRGLGVTRTLVLVDGRRFVPANNLGSVDINDLPSQLIKRVDVVTGGASAAYGSDAVAGVVNFILDTNFTGLKGEVSGGQSSRGDFQNYKFGIAGGTTFAEGKGHITASLDYLHSDAPKAEYGDDRPWMQRIANYISNPVAGGLPLRISSSDTRAANSSFGGLITTPGPLRGVQFGPGGVVQQHDFGAINDGRFQSGGDSTAVFDPYSAGAYQKPLVTGFVHVNYDVAPDITLFAEATHTYQNVGYWQFWQYHNASAGNGITIFQDNAFLPASVRSTMVANNIASFAMGRYDTEGPGDYIDSYQHVTSFSVGARGKLFGMDFNSYATHGYSIMKVNGWGFIEQKYFAAIDSVINPANGQPVCRSTLLFGTNPGCSPFNPFGAGSPSAAATNYVQGLGWRKDQYTQDAAGFDLRKDAFSLWSDPVSVAAGVDWRREELERKTDPISQQVTDFTGVRGGPASENGRLGGFQTQNDQPFTGKYHVLEGFLEANVPVLKDRPLVNRLDLNLAGRITDYSTSGTVETWKLGAVYKPTSELALRATLSQDIRAPNLTELFGAGSAVGGTSSGGTINPITKTSVLFVGFTTVGNPNLKPEIGRTTTVGLVYQPQWLPRFVANIDYYNIHITNALGVTSNQDTLNQCLLQQIPAACSQIISVTPTVVTWRQLYQNLAQARTSGVDFEANYGFDMFGGDATVRFLANYISEASTTNPGAQPIDLAGQYNRPHWRSNLQFNYVKEGWNLFAQARYLGEGNLNNIWVEGRDIDNNHVKAITYVDLTISKDFKARGGDYQAFLTINNLLDQDPPVEPINNAVIQSNDYNYYDQVGRRFVAGVKFHF